MVTAYHVPLYLDILLTNCVYFVCAVRIHSHLCLKVKTGLVSVIETRCSFIQGMYWIFRCYLGDFLVQMVKKTYVELSFAASVTACSKAGFVDYLLWLDFTFPFHLTAVLSVGNFYAC